MSGGSSFKRIASLFTAFLGACFALGLALLGLTSSSASISATSPAPDGSLFLVLSVEKTARRASIYTVTNVSSMTASTAHEFYDVDLEQGLHTFTDQLAPFESKAYDLAGIPEIPYDVVDVVYISSDQPVAGTSNICAPTIRSVESGAWRDPATWDLGRVPNSNDVVMIQPEHRVTGGPAAPGLFGGSAGRIAGLCNTGVLESAGRGALTIVATEFISNYGDILGKAGTTVTGGGCRLSAGASIKLSVKGGPIYNKGFIEAGRGGNGVDCGGRGGSVWVAGRNVTNEGTICAGDGGHISGTGRGAAGDGGDTIVVGKYGGPGFLINTGFICAGDGGRAHFAATQPQRGGDGGKLKLISLPDVILDGGEHRAGSGGLGAGGGADGRDGPVFIEPNTISLAGAGTRVTGGDILIFGGDNWTLDLRNMDSAAVDATGGITLAVGVGGVVDLSGNTAQAFQAGGQVVIAADVISLDAGVALSDVVGTNFVTGPGRILYDVSLVGPGQTTGSPGHRLSISLTLLNGGPTTDTYTLSWLDTAGWDLGGLPATTTVGGLDLQDLALNVTPAGTALISDQNLITITARSLANPNVHAVETVDVLLEALREIYLPLVLRDR